MTYADLIIWLVRITILTVVVVGIVKTYRGRNKVHSAASSSHATYRSDAATENAVTLTIHIPSKAVFGGKVRIEVNGSHLAEGTFRNGVTTTTSLVPGSHLLSVFIDAPLGINRKCDYKLFFSTAGRFEVTLKYNRTMGTFESDPNLRPVT